MDLNVRRNGFEVIEGGGLLEPPLPAAEEPPPQAPRHAAAPPAGVRQYEELDGQEGRSVFFRPHRYGAADLAPLAGVVAVELHGIRHEAPVRDVSQNGVAFPWPRGLAVSPRDRLRVSLRFDEHELFRGEAVVGSVRAQDGATVVGVAFEDFLLDVDEILQLRTVAAWRHGASAREGRDWHVRGDTRFKALVAEFRLLLEDGRRELDALEATLPWHVLNGPRNPARAALEARLRAGLAAEIIRYTEEIDAAVRALPGGHGDPAARAWSRRHVHEFLMHAPANLRALEKPFGYPGDYEVMNFIYERQFAGATLFGCAVELAFTNTAPARAVRGRKDVVRARVEALLAERAGTAEPVRVLSIAAGPAQELHELLLGLEELPAPLEVVLFEQDKNALAHAWRRLEPAARRLRGRLRLRLLHDTVKRLLRDGAMFEDLGPFDLTYSCGLFDYFQARTATVLTRNLFSTTAPGGALLVANMVDHPGRWYMETHLDWPLLYRTREELLEIGRRAAPGARHRIVEDPTGVNPFVELVRQPAG